jgi:hypothetical protein
MAAGLDIPSTVIYTSNEKPPLEIRPLSPNSLLVTTMDASQIVSPTLNTVYYSFLFQLQHAKTGEIHLPSCPACLRLMLYTTQASRRGIILMCVCGTKRLIPLETIPSVSSPLPHLPSLEYPINVQSDLETQSKVEHFSDTISSDNPQRIELVLREEERWGWERVNSEGPIETEGIHWSFDGLVFFMSRKGFHLIEVEKKEDLSAGTSEMLVFSNSERGKHPLKISWGGKLLRVPDDALYKKYFTWRTWANLDRLQSIPKILIQFGEYTEAAHMASILFNMDPNPKTFRWLLRSRLHQLFKR